MRLTKFSQIARRKKEQAGFSLVELMVVVFIMGLLATLIIINVAPVGDRSRITKATSDIASLESALEQYSLDLYNYPSSADGLAALTIAPPTSAPATRAWGTGKATFRLPSGRQRGSCPCPCIRNCWTTT